MPGMPTLHRWRWWLTDEVTGKRRKTSWHMTEQQAALYPGAEKVDGTYEPLQVSDDPLDLSAASVQSGPPKDR